VRAAPVKRCWTYSIYDSDPDVSGFELVEEDYAYAYSEKEARADILQAMEVAASGLSPVDGYSPGDELFALVWAPDGDVRRLRYVITPEDLGVTS